MSNINRLKAVQPPFSEETTQILDQYPTRDGYLLNLFRVFANSTRFLKKGTLNLLDRDSPIDMRDREIIILRVCANNHCEYEWGVHVAAFGAHVGLTEAQIAATCAGAPDEACWQPRERLLLRVVDELCDRGRLSGSSAEAFAREWTIEQQLEIYALCGNYHTVSFVANNAELALEDFAARFP